MKRFLSLLALLPAALTATLLAVPTSVTADESNRFGVYTVGAETSRTETAPMPREKEVSGSAYMIGLKYGQEKGWLDKDGKWTSEQAKKDALESVKNDLANPQCCGFVGQDVPAPPPQEGPKLGRAKPLKQFDYGDFKAVVGTDGVTRYFPRIGKFIDNEKKKAPPPAAINYGAKAPNVLKKMYLNNKYGCCVLSSRIHQFGIINAVESGTEVFATDQEVYDAYCGFCSSINRCQDGGCNMASVNQLQQTKGIVIGGKVRKIEGTVSVDHTNKELVMTMIVVSGGLNLGMDLPNAWYNSADGSDWAPTNSSIVGGHEVQAYGYDDKGVWISTWGGTRRITWTAFTSKKWIDECYSALLPEWYASDGVAANGIDAAGLKAAFAEVADGKVPVLPDPKPPTPPQPPVPPQPPTPPVPGTGYTGTLVFQNGILIGAGSVTPPVNPPVPPVVVPPVPGNPNPALEELKNRIAKAQARKDGAGLIVTRAELAAARAKLEAGLSDEALLQLAAEKKIPVVKDGNKAGGLSDFFEWIITHQAEITAFIDFIIKILSGLGMADPMTPTYYTVHGVSYWLAA